jgi:hypothetical protein
MRQSTLKRELFPFIIIVSSVVCMQLAAGKAASVSLLWLYLGICVWGLINAERIHVSSLAALFLGIGFVLYQIRPSVFLDGHGYLDAMAFLPLALAFTAYRYSPYIARESTYRSILLMSIAVMSSNLVIYWFGISLDWFASEPYAGTRWVGGVDGPNEFAQVCVAILALGLGLSIEGKVGRAFVSVLIVICSACVVITFSRGGIGALGVILAVYLLATRPNRVAFAVLAAIASIVWFVYLDEAIGDALRVFSEVRVNAGGRDDVLYALKQLLMERPAFGGGFGIYSVSGLGEDDAPHSDFVYFLTSGGIVAGLFMLVIAIRLFRFFYARGMYAELMFFFAILLNGLVWNSLVRLRLSTLIFFVLVIGLRCGAAMPRMRPQFRVTAA